MFGSAGFFQGVEFPTPPGYQLIFSKSLFSTRSSSDLLAANSVGVNRDPDTNNIDVFTLNTDSSIRQDILNNSGQLIQFNTFYDGYDSPNRFPSVTFHTIQDGKQLIVTYANTITGSSPNVHRGYLTVFKKEPGALGGFVPTQFIDGLERLTSGLSSTAYTNVSLSDDSSLLLLSSSANGPRDAVLDYISVHIYRDNGSSWSKVAELRINPAEFAASNTPISARLTGTFVNNGQYIIVYPSGISLQNYGYAVWTRTGPTSWSGPTMAVGPTSLTSVGPSLMSFDFDGPLVLTPDTGLNLLTGRNAGRTTQKGTVNGPAKMMIYTHSDVFSPPVLNQTIDNAYTPYFFNTSTGLPNTLVGGRFVFTKTGDHLISTGNRSDRLAIAVRNPADNTFNLTPMSEVSTVYTGQIERADSLSRNDRIPAGRANTSNYQDFFGNPYANAISVSPQITNDLIATIGYVDRRRYTYSTNRFGYSRLVNQLGYGAYLNVFRYKPHS